MKVLITGGAGYIGSTIASAMIDSGHTPIILDSLVTGKEAFTRDRIFYQADIADGEALDQIFNDHPDIEACIHCAAFIVVPDSVSEPRDYYVNNVCKSITLFEHLNRLGCNKIVFSSSASLYATSDEFLVTEESPLNPISPYARTKYMMEMILRDFCAAYGMRGIALRYFNPIGADPKLRSGLHVRYPSLVLGKMVDTILGKYPYFSITGTDYTTRDGTGIRDYVHVWDLAKAHILAVTEFDKVFERAGNPDDNYLVINLGTGNGVTVRELVTAFEHVYGEKLPQKDMPRRPGDQGGAYASRARAMNWLGWKPELSIEDGIRDALAWGKKRIEILGFE
ncbi:MAG: UDP-glucose 4-epimerase GalE [Anaerolineaceae bacterium]|nr:UDP-glucose 4-epimerase GalE [Anaerolineaceae bacterium]